MKKEIIKQHKEKVREHFNEGHEEVKVQPAFVGKNRNDKKWLKKQQKQKFKEEKRREKAQKLVRNFFDIFS